MNFWEKVLKYGTVIINLKMKALTCKYFYHISSRLFDSKYTALGKLLVLHWSLLDLSEPHWRKAGGYRIY